MNVHFRKIFSGFGMALVVLISSAVPLTTVHAADEADPPPPGRLRQAAERRLEQVWARQQRHYARIGDTLRRTDIVVDRFRGLIDRLTENGKDVSSLQAALDAFNEAIRDAHPVYESAQGIIHSHRGFDAEGNILDVDEARGTVQAMGEKMQELGDVMAGTGRALREAFRAFRIANPPPQAAES